jgi:hypothetical protein
MVESLTRWVREVHDKRRIAEGRAGVLVQHNDKGGSAEILVISVLHACLQKPVLKTFDKVKVHMKKLRPLHSTSTRNIQELDRQLAHFLLKFGLNRNARGKPIRCNGKLTVRRVRRNAAGRSIRCSGKMPPDSHASIGLNGTSSVITPKKKAAKWSTRSCFSEAKARKGQQLRLKFADLEIVFNSAEDAKRDEMLYLAALSANSLKACEWQPVGKPHVVDTNGMIYDGKPKLLDKVSFPLTVKLKLFRVA